MLINTKWTKCEEQRC